MKNKTFKFLLFLVILVCLIRKSYEVFFVLDPYESRCISKKIHEKSNFSGLYFVSGEDETGNIAVIKNPLRETIWSANSHKSGSFNLYVEREGN